MKIEEILKYHPSLRNPEYWADVCKPLKELGITYFGHGRVAEDGKVSGVSSDPEYFKHYLENEFYNLDLHSEMGMSKLKYILWDNIEPGMNTQKYMQLKREFGMYHTFTIVRSVDEVKNFYHFARHSKNDKMNNFYIKHIDLLESFIDYYQDKLLLNNSLNKAYQIYIPVTKVEANTNFVIANPLEVNDQTIDNYLESINSVSSQALQQPTVVLSRREAQCAHYLLEGKTAKQIGELLNISSRTVEVYIDRLKIRFQCNNKFQLAAKLAQIDYEVKDD